MEIAKLIINIIFIISGSVSLWASIRNSDWLFNSENASMLIRLVGRPVARLIYGGFGCILIGVGIYLVRSGSL